MKKATTIFLALIVLLVGCNNDDDTSPALSIEGNWKLVQISGGFSGTIYNFTPGTVVWDFNESDTNITVTSTVETDTYYGLSAGSHEYELSSNDNCNNSINILLDDYYANFGCSTIEGNTLTLNNGYADGEIYTFVR
ncbi:hypothetical protein ACLI09_16260 [Flavobacterium sp. RHBU_24]|uniref:hypothetical protein n=1 Tax=Flavobacterium sp. RHBU_24 TaxID=3391185 RepID=UPI003984909A